MRKTIIDRNYNRLVDRAIARSYMKDSLSSCPTCAERRKPKDVKKIMSEIRQQFHG